MAINFRRKLEGVAAQLNPFDQGKTYSSVVNQPQRPAPQGGGSVSVGAPVSQAPAYTPGRISVSGAPPSQQPQPQSNFQIARNAFQSNPVGRVAGGLASSFALPYNVVGKGLGTAIAQVSPDVRRAKASQDMLAEQNKQSVAALNQQLRNPGLSVEQRAKVQKAVGAITQNTQDVMGQQAQTAQDVAAITDPRKQAASIGSIGFDIATLGVGTGGTKAVSAALKSGGIKQAAKTLGTQSAKTAGLAAPSGALFPVIEKGKDATIKDILTGAGTAAAFGAALPGISSGVAAGAKPIVKAIKGAPKLNQVGAIGKDVTGKGAPDPLGDIRPIRQFAEQYQPKNASDMSALRSFMAATGQLENMGIQTKEYNRVVNNFIKRSGYNGQGTAKPVSKNAITNGRTGTELPTTGGSRVQPVQAPTKTAPKNTPNPSRVADYDRALEQAKTNILKENWTLETVKQKFNAGLKDQNLSNRDGYTELDAYIKEKYGSIDNFYNQATHSTPPKGVAPKGAPIEKTPKPVVTAINEPPSTAIGDARNKLMLAKAGIATSSKPKLVVKAKTPTSELPKLNTPASGYKTRGFYKTIFDDPKTPSATKQALLDFDTSYKTMNIKETKMKADNLIKADIDTAVRLANANEGGVSSSIGSALIEHYGKVGQIEDAIMMAQKVSRTATENGQANAMLAGYGKLTPEGILRFSQQQIGKYNKKTGKNVKLDTETADNLLKAAEKIEKMPDGADKNQAIAEMVDLASSKNISSAAEKGVTLWKALLLSAPTTHLGNILSNSVELVMKKALIDPLAAAIDIPVSLITGKRSKVATVRGISGGVGEGFDKGYKYATTGFDIRRNNLNKVDMNQKIVWGNGPGGKLGKTLTESIFRALGVEDHSFYYASLRNTLKEMAILSIKNEKLKLHGADRTKYINDFVKNPTESAVKIATTDAERATWTNKTALGTAAGSAKRALGPAGEYFMPFSQVPSSIATRILERSPLGYIKAGNTLVKGLKNGSFDQRGFVEQLSNATVGTGFALVVGKVLVDHDLMTLAYPTDQKEQALWQTEGKQPYSVKVGNNWLSLNYIQPYGSILAAGAVYQDAIKKGKNQQSALAAAAGGAGQSIINQSFLQGIGNTIAAVTDPQRKGESYVESAAGSIVPNLIKKAATATDPNQREINGAGEAIIAGIPGLREKLNPKLNMFGEPLPRQSTPLNVFANPLKPSKILATNDDVIKELRRLQDAKEGVIPTSINKNFLSKDETKSLTKDQINKLTATVNPGTKEVWSQIVSSDAYKNMSDADKKNALSKANVDIRAIAKAQILGNDPSLATADEAAKAQKLTARQKAILEQGFDPVAFLQKKATTSDKTAKAKTTKGKVASSGGGRRVSRKGSGGGGSKAAAVKAVNPYKYSVSLSAGGSIAKPKVQARATGAVKSQKVAKAKPKVSIKKSTA